MTISPSVKLHAYYYFFGLGLNVTTIKNEWTDYNLKRGDKLKSPYCKPNLYGQTFVCEDKFEENKDAFYELDWNNSVGVGLMLDGIEALDFDGCTSFDLILSVLKKLELPSDYEWLVRSGSGKGFHILYRIKENYIYTGWNSTYFPNEKYSDKFEWFEIRTGGHLVLPPSVHNSTMRYEFVNGRVPMKLPVEINRDCLLDTINAFSNREVQFIDVSTGCIRVKPMDASATEKFFARIPIMDDRHGRCLNSRTINL